MEVFMIQNLIGIKEMASRLDVPVSWLYSRTRTNEIPYFKVGKYVKFDAEKVMRWISEQNEIEKDCNYANR
jgi:excisionase family DNA binding protein